MERVKTAAGQARVQTCWRRARTVLSNFDIYAQAGYHTAMVKSAPVTVTGGAPET